MRRPLLVFPSELCHQNASRTTCPAQRQAFFCVVFFGATKKMTLLSGNPDGFRLLNEKKNNRLTICYSLFISDHSGKTKLCQQPERPSKRPLFLSLLRPCSGLKALSKWQFARSEEIVSCIPWLDFDSRVALVRSVTSGAHTTTSRPVPLITLYMPAEKFDWTH